MRLEFGCSDVRLIELGHHASTDNAETSPTDGMTPCYQNCVGSKPQTTKINVMISENAEWKLAPLKQVRDIVIDFY